MYGAVVTPSADADLDVFFIHNEGYSTMCGHAIIALTKLAVETGLVNTNEMTINVPGLGLNERITIESILGSTMSVQVLGVTNFGPYDAIIPEISGTASITGRNEFYFDPDDSLRRGFIFR